MDAMHESMSNHTITCNYCGKQQCVVVPYQTVDSLVNLKIVAERFLSAVEGYHQSPFDLSQVKNYARKKTEFMGAFGIKSISEILDSDDACVESPC